MSAIDLKTCRFLLLAPRVNPGVLLKIAVEVPNQRNPSELQSACRHWEFFLVVVFFPSTLNVVLTLQNHHEHLLDLKQLCSSGRDNLRCWKSERASHERKDLSGWARAGMWPWNWQGWLSPVCCTGRSLHSEGTGAEVLPAKVLWREQQPCELAGATQRSFFLFFFYLVEPLPLLNLLCVCPSCWDANCWQCAGLKSTRQTMGLVIFCMLH